MVQIKLLEYVAAENPDLFVVSMHPGVVDTDLVKSMATYGEIDPAFFDDGMSLSFRLFMI